LSRETRGRWRRIAPFFVFAGCSLLLLALRPLEDGPGRLVLEAALALGTAVAVYLALRRKKASLSQGDEVFESIAEALFVLTPEGRIVAANPAARIRFGRSLDDRIDGSFAELFPGSGRAALRAIEAQLRRRGRARVEATGRRGDGGEFAAVIRASRLKGSDDSSLLVSVEDVTAQRRTTRQRAQVSRKVLAAQEEERTRVSRDLHDGLGQMIAAVHFEIDWLRKQAPGQSLTGEDFARSVGLIEQAGEKLRRICRGLRPPMLDDLGLMPAIRQLVDEFAEHSTLRLNLEIHIDEDRYPVPPDVALCTFRVLQEALTNVVRHAEASEVDVTLVRDAGSLVLSVYDNGKGFDPERLAGAPGFGVEGMRERAQLVEGTLELQAAPNEGTRIVFRAPLPVPVEEDGP